jgi:hypothetical protein
VPSLDLRFADNKSMVDAVTGASLVTFTRASSKTVTNSAGVLETVGIDVPAFDHNPTTGESLGLLVEEQRTNSIRNNTMVGAVAGTPGTLPTNWSGAPVSNGLSRQIVGVGTQSGITYIDIRYSGTTTAASSTVIQPETGAQTVAATGQSWTASSWLSLAGGSASGLTFAQRITGRTSIGGFLEFTDTSVSLTGTLTRYAASIALANVLTARVSNDIAFSYASGVAIDLTLRIGLPQLEQGEFATSPIPTSTAAVTRSADVASITGSAFSSWYRQDEGTVFADAKVTTVAPATSRTSVFALSDGTTSNRITVYKRANADTSTRLDVETSGSNVAFISAGIFGVSNLIAASYRVDDFAISLNGLTPGTDTLGAVPAISRLNIGGFADSTFPLNGTIRRITYWPVRLGNNVLQQVTQ